MKLRHKDLEIPNLNPFENCILEREQYAEILTHIVGSYADGFVMAIDNEWGTGKTTFVKMWALKLENVGFKTLYFNAWENDFDNNPLIPIMAELKPLINDKGNATFKSILKKGALLTKKLLPTIIKAVVEKHIDSKTISESIEKISETAADILEDEINKYASKKQDLIDFKKELSSAIANNSDSKPIIFIIDELDRCRPNYAVEVLEQIKHFFSVPGIVFILSIDKVQLGNSIKGVYGTDLIDSNEYLRRFIDLEYRIPVPTSKIICKYFYKFFEFEAFFNAPNRISFTKLKNDGNNFLEFISIINEKDKLTIRRLEKLFVHSRLVLSQFNFSQRTIPQLLFFLIYLRDSDFDSYRKIINRELSMQEIVEIIEIKFQKYINDNNSRLFLYIESWFILLYFNFLKEVNYNLKLFIKNSPELEEELSIISKFDKDIIAKIINEESRGIDNLEFYPLTFLINKIELLETISI